MLLPRGPGDPTTCNVVTGPGEMDCQRNYSIENGSDKGE
jgi:hypothetical protein